MVDGYGIDIPDFIFQIIISDGPVDEKNFSEALEANVNSIRSLYRGAKYHIYNDAEIQEVISSEFDRDVIDAYRSLQPYAFKSDLARYCILFLKGGLYSDLSFLHLRRIGLEREKDLLVFRDISKFHPGWAICNGLILARPRHAVMQAAIDQVVAHHKSGFYGDHCLEPTGPYMFGRIIRRASQKDRISFGTLHLINQEANRNSNIAGMLPGNRMFCVRNKRVSGSIAELVSGGVNEYHALWLNRSLWAPNEQSTDQGYHRKRGFLLCGKTRVLDLFRALRHRLLRALKD